MQACPALTSSRSQPVTFSCSLSHWPWPRQGWAGTLGETAPPSLGLGLLAAGAGGASPELSPRAQTRISHSPGGPRALARPTSGQVTGSLAALPRPRGSGIPESPARQLGGQELTAFRALSVHSQLRSSALPDTWMPLGQRDPPNPRQESNLLECGPETALRRPHGAPHTRMQRDAGRPQALPSPRRTGCEHKGAPSLRCGRLLR